MRMVVLKIENNTLTPVEVTGDEPLRVADYLHYDYAGEPVITGIGPPKEVEINEQ
jgi:hypothetical protein